MVCIGSLKLDDDRFFHEKVLEEIEKNQPTEIHLNEKFPDYSYIISTILERELRNGLIEEYKKENQVHYRITERGNRLLNINLKRPMRIGTRNY